jgi:nicotinamide-nucleotide amidase
MSGAAQRVVDTLTAQGLTIAVAESLSGGLIAAAITDIPGASAVLRGAVVAYATDIKVSLLDVDAELVAEHGAVHPDVALQMAVGVARLLRSDIGVACTGVAGPDSQDGQPPGQVFIAVATANGTRVHDLTVPGDREQVRAATVEHALGMVLRAAGLKPS